MNEICIRINNQDVKFKAVLLPIKIILNNTEEYYIQKTSNERLIMTKEIREDIKKYLHKSKNSVSL